MQKERLLAQMAMGNGLVISFLDGSKNIAGDRCQVQLHISIPILIETVMSPQETETLEGFSEFAAAFEGEIQYRLTKVRNFIRKDLLAATVDRMKDDFLAANAAYLANPCFARRYILSRFQEWKRQTAWEARHREAIMKADIESASP